MLQPLLPLFFEFLWRRDFDRVLGDEFGAHATFRDADDVESARDKILLHNYLLARVKIPGGLGGQLVDVDTASAAGISREGAGFEYAHGPKPFVETRPRGRRCRVVGVRKQNDRESVRFAVASKRDFEEDYFFTRPNSVRSQSSSSAFS